MNFQEITIEEKLTRKYFLIFEGEKISANALYTLLYNIVYTGETLFSYKFD